MSVLNAIVLSINEVRHALDGPAWEWCYPESKPFIRAVIVNPNCYFDLMKDMDENFCTTIGSPPRIMGIPVLRSHPSLKTPDVSSCKTLTFFLEIVFPQETKDEDDKRCCWH